MIVRGYVVHSLCMVSITALLIFALPTKTIIVDDNDPQKSLYDVDNDATVITVGDWYGRPSYSQGSCR